jgi:hypothetical protein
VTWTTESWTCRDDSDPLTFTAYRDGESVPGPWFEYRTTQAEKCTYVGVRDLPTGYAWSDFF